MEQPRNNVNPQHIRYRCTVQQYSNEDFGPYSTSGIVALDTAGSVVACVDDVSCDREMVEALVSRLNQGQAAPEHLIDIVLDVLEA